MVEAAPVVDPELARLFAGQRDPIEALLEEQVIATAFKDFSVEALLKRGRLVKLACRHFTVTKSLRRAKCPRCGEMIRAGYDYDGFRRLGSADRFSWPSDPLRALHESSAEVTTKRWFRP